MAGFVVALTRMVGWPCFALCYVVGLGLALGLMLYTRETQTGGRIYPSIERLDCGITSVVALLLCPLCVCVCMCVAHLLLLPCVLFRPSIHPFIAIHCIRNSYCVGGRSHPFTIHIYESAKLDLLDVVVYGGRRRERASKRAVLTRYYTQRRQRGRFPLNPQNATVPRQDTMEPPTHSLLHDGLLLACNFCSVTYSELVCWWGMPKRVPLHGTSWRKG